MVIVEPSKNKNKRTYAQAMGEEPQKGTESGAADSGIAKRPKLAESTETVMTSKVATEKGKVFDSMFLKGVDQQESNEDRKPGHDFMTRCIKWGL